MRTGVPLRSEGQRRLLEVPVSTTALARHMGVSAAHVSSWRAGDRLPGPLYRATLARLYGIPTTAWNVGPGRDPSAGISRTGGSLAAEDLTALIEQCRRDLTQGNLSHVSRARMVECFVRATELRTRIEHANLFAAPEFFRLHPCWRELRVKLLDAVRGSSVEHQIRVIIEDVESERKYR